jgi:transposase
MRQELSMSRRKRRAFSDEFKREAVGLTRVGDRTIAQVARDLDLTETALREWVKRAEEEAAPTPVALTAIERDELLRLRKQVKRLEMEREILKNYRAQRRLLLDEKLLSSYASRAREERPSAYWCF